MASQSGQKTDSRATKPGLKDRLRQRYGWLDHLLRMQEHYVRVRGNQMAGAVTYFSFLSLFPIIAMVFTILSRFLGDNKTLKDNVQQFFTDNMPGLVGTDQGQINLDQIGNAAGSKVGVALLIAVVGFLYSGLGWLDSTREALRQMWALEPEKTSLVKRKLADMLILLMLGSAIAVGTLTSTIATGLSTTVLGWVGLQDSMVGKVVLVILGWLLGVLATTGIFAIVFARLPGHRLPWKNVMTGALLGAVAVELLKQFGVYLLKGSAGNQTLYGIFAIIIGALVYLNFIARITMYAAAWCVVGPVPTVEEKIAAQGESLDQGEAQATSHARKHADDQDEEQSVGVPHDSSGGSVGATTMDLQEENGSGSLTGSAPAHGGCTNSGCRCACHRQSGTTAGQPSRPQSKGSLFSFMALIGLVGMRMRKKRTS